KAPPPEEKGTKAEKPVAEAPTEAPKPVGAAEFTGVVKVEQSGGGNTVTVKHSTTGRVASVTVREGQKVKRGQTLLTYEDVETLRQLETARENCRSLREIAEARDDERVRRALKDCQADVARKEAQLASGKLGASCEGTVTDVNAVAGKRAGKGTPAFKLSCGGSGKLVTVAAVLPEANAKGVRVGSKATVEIEDQSYDAEVQDVTSMPSGLRVVLGLEKSPANASEGDSAKIRFAE
ncbi:MAG: biotin/lipoyl-binding protein, partial [Myxococcota bacterium]